jgi:hypothetical protein
LRTGAANPLDGEDVGDYSTPALGDLDGDGDLDLVTSEKDGAFSYFENAILKPALSAFELSGGANPLAGQDVGSVSTPVHGDLDADGDLDLVAGGFNGRFFWFENTGDAASPTFVRRTGASNPLDGSDVGYSATPALGDLDADGDLDVVAGMQAGSFAYLENTGSATSPAFALRTGASNPFDGQSVGSRSAPSLGDLDGDGDLDLVGGAYAGGLTYLENTGNAASPSFALVTGASNPFDGSDLGADSTPALGDLDGDGDLDLLGGNFSGTFEYFENTGSATSPAFEARTGPANPLDGQSTAGLSAPGLGDLDGDGDLDVVAGDNGGAFRTFYLPEPAQGLLLGAGIALLSQLARLRGRRPRAR